MTPQAVLLLFGYSYWAFERVWASVAQLTDAQFTQHLGYSVGSIRNQVVHLMSSTQRWMGRLRGGVLPERLVFEHFPTRQTAKAQWDLLAAEAMTYARSLDASQLAEPVHFDLASRGISHDSLRWELLLHVANHATDHRAQILAMLHESFGIRTEEQDLLLYLVHAADR